MDNKNTIFNITPPDIRLSHNGPSILLLGIALADSKQYINIIDNYFLDVEVSYYASVNSLDNDTAGWYRAVSTIVNSIVINIDTMTSAELMIGLEAAHSDKVIYWISTNNKNNLLKKLLNSYGYQLFNSIQELDDEFAELATKNT